MHQGVSKPIPHLHPLASPPSPSPPPPPASPPLLLPSPSYSTVQCTVSVNTELQGNSALLYRTVHLICIQLLLRNAHSSRYDPDAAQEIELRSPSDLLILYSRLGQFVSKIRN